jgi:methyltransferase
MTLAYVIIGAVALQRLLELLYARRNTRALLARGAVEIAPAQYPLLVLLHVVWLAAIALRLPSPLVIYWFPLAVFLLLQGARIWVIASLGPFWTTRIITLPDAPLVRRGPYRFLRHPNYAVVIGEIAVLPLVFGEIGIAIAFSAANALLLWWRIRQEDAALAPRRSLPE